MNGRKNHINEKMRSRTQWKISYAITKPSDDDELLINVSRSWFSSIIFFQNAQLSSEVRVVVRAGEHIRESFIRSLLHI